MKLIIFAIITAIGALGAMIYVLVIAPTQPTIVDDASISSQAPATAEVPAAPLQGTDTLQSLLSRAQSLECQITYEDTEINTSVSGTYFVSEGRLRGDFVSQVEGMEVVSSMILVDEQFYTWSEVLGERYGMRIDLTKTTLGAEDQPDTREPVPLDAPVTYECQLWLNVDASVFVPPGDILWQDYGALMERGMEAPVLFEDGSTPTSMTIPGAGDPCSLCLQVPAGPGQAECLANFDCPRSE